MKKNVFDGTAAEDMRPHLSHAQIQTLLTSAQSLGSFKKALAANPDVLAHAGTFGIDNMDYLFPDAVAIDQTPSLIAREMAWVENWLNGTKHRPFRSIKSIHANITADEARAKGYVKGALKVDEVFGLLRRITTPTMVYKKQRLDREDIISITEMDVVAWLWTEMRMMYKEEIARAALVGDGREVADPDKISETNIRPVWTDADLYAIKVLVAAADTANDMIDTIIESRINYRGTGRPNLYAAPSFIIGMLLLRDLDGRRLYKTRSELADELDVNAIIEVPVMTGLNREASTDVFVDLRAIILNPVDYSYGAVKGGELTTFSQFDIDYNQEKYLMEGYLCGALTVPYSAIVVEQSRPVA